MVIYENRIASSFQAVDDAVHEIVDALKSLCNIHDKHLLFKVSFMLREIMNNAVEHGNRFDLSKYVTCSVSFEETYLMFVVSDEGAGIPESLARVVPNSEKLLRERQRGYETIRDMAFEISIEGTCVTVKLHIN